MTKGIAIALCISALLVAGCSSSPADYEILEAEVNIWMYRALSISYSLHFNLADDSPPITTIDFELPVEGVRTYNIHVDVDDNDIYDLDYSTRLENGVTIDLGENEIRPGRVASFHFSIDEVKDILTLAPNDRVQLFLEIPNILINDQPVEGKPLTFVRVTFPEPVSAEAAEWEPADEEFGLDPDVSPSFSQFLVYTWIAQSADLSKDYSFTVFFPTQYAPPGSVSR